jgi:hypothetical protein
MEKQKSPVPGRTRLGVKALITKRGLTKLLHDYETKVKSQDQIKPFIDSYFEQLRRLNQGVK